MLDLLDDCAERAEQLRQRSAEVVLVLGAEISLLNKGFLPDDTLIERLTLLSDRQQLGVLIPEVRKRVNDFFGKAVAVVREWFGGKITYAAMQFEGVDWTPFDIISFDSYRSAEVAPHYADGIRSLAAQGKPVAITEFGMTPYKGAADIGARAGEIVVWDEDTALPRGLKGSYIRDEDEQATYVRELLEIFAEGGIDSAFVFTFVQYSMPHRADPHNDLDIASYGIVKVYENRFGSIYPDMTWEPKAAFKVIADFYAN